MPRWLLSRLFDAADQPKPRFAFHGTVNWMRALALSIDTPAFDNEAIRGFYQHVQRRRINADADTLVFENVFMAFNHIAGLSSIANDVGHPYDACRSAIIAWYYGIYFSASAMVAAASGTKQETHAATAKVWHADLVENDLVLRPFSPSLSSLVTSVSDEEISAYRGSNPFDLNQSPDSLEKAWGAIVSYMKGTAEHERWKVEDRVRKTPEFRALDVDNFRTRAAREVRDQYLRRGRVNFLVQASRYRGKANYRDSIFLSYGEDQSDKIDQFLVDLKSVSVSFLRMACGYCLQRVERGTWGEFVDDVEINSRLSLDVDILRLG